MLVMQVQILLDYSPHLTLSAAARDTLEAMRRYKMSKELKQHFVVCRYKQRSISFRNAQEDFEGTSHLIAYEEMIKEKKEKEAAIAAEVAATAAEAKAKEDTNSLETLNTAATAASDDEGDDDDVGLQLNMY